MAVTGSEPISITDLHAEFGGTGPITDYYKDGGLVPSTRAGYYTYGSYSADQYDFFAPRYLWQQLTSSGDFKECWWNGTLIASGSALAVPRISGGYEYEKTTILGSSGGYDYWGIKRRTATWNPAVSINASVPTSGDISLTDFYSSTAT